MTCLDAAARFLSLLDERDAFTFQTFPDAAKDAGSAGSPPRVYHGSLDELGPLLVSLNEEGAGIFAMVNAGDGVVREGAKTCRTAANVIRVRALFVDLDDAPIAPVLASALPPDWVVHSSAARWHAYWKVPDYPLERFACAQAALARRCGGDLAVKDLPRVMRIPGFFHRKSDPFLSTLHLPPDYNNILEANNE
jgi:DNA primase RepB-like protein